jgi:hypothetical protein
MIGPTSAAAGQFRRTWWLPGIVERTFVVLYADLDDDEQPVLPPWDLPERFERALGDPLLGQSLAEMGHAVDPNFCLALNHGLIPGQRRFLAGRLAAAFQDRRLALVGVPAVHQTGTRQVPPPPAKPGGKEPAKEKKTWIEFKLVDDQTGKPYSGVRLRITTPDGIENFYTTNSSGLVRIEEIDPGTCDVGEVLDDDALEVVSVA